MEKQKNLSKVSAGADKKERDQAYNGKSICDGGDYLLHRTTDLKYL